MPRNLDDDLDALLSIGAEEKKPEAPKTEAPKTEPAAVHEATGEAEPEGKSESRQRPEAEKPQDSASAELTPELADSAGVGEPVTIINDMADEEIEKIAKIIAAEQAEVRAAEEAAAAAASATQAAASQAEDVKTTPIEEEAAMPEAEEEAVEDEQIEDEHAAPEQEEQSAWQAEKDDESEIGGDQCDGPELTDSVDDSDRETRDEEELVPTIHPTPPPPPIPPKGKEKTTPAPRPRKPLEARWKTPRIIQKIEDRTNRVILALIAAAAVGGGAAALLPDKEPRCSIERTTREQLRPVCNNIPGAPAVGKDWKCKKNGPGFDCTARVEIPSQNLASQDYLFRLPEVKQSVDFRNMKFEKKPGY